MLEKLLRSGAVEPATCKSFVSKSRLEPKKDGGYRLIVDLRPINRHLNQQKFRYEDIRHLGSSLHQDDWSVSFDLRNGYYHLPIHPAHRKYLTTSIAGQLVSFTALPFGLSTAPFAFTKFMRPVIQALRASGVRIFPYLDDFLIADRSREATTRARDRAAELFARLGLQRHPQKGQWEPARTIRHLGMEIDLPQGLFKVPPDKLLSIKSTARSLLTYAKRHRRWCTGHRLESFVGATMALSLAMPAARTLTRSLYDCLAARSSRSEDAKLSRQAQRDLQALADLQESQTASPIWPKLPTMTLTTDASQYGWGACCGDQTVRAFFTEAERRLHITAKELLAVEKALKWLPEQVTDTTLRLRTDNMAVLFCLRNRVSGSPTMMTILRRILTDLSARRLLVQAEYISTDVNPADPLSRQRDKTDWAVSGSFFARWRRIYLWPTIDRFATAANKKCPRFNSWRWEPGSEGDAMLANWRDEFNWVNPPFSMLAGAISKIVTERASALLLAPHWPSAPWFPEVLRHGKIVELLRPDRVRKLVKPSNPALPEPLRNPAWSMMIVLFDNENWTWKSDASSRPSSSRLRRPHTKRPSRRFGASAPYTM